MGAWSPSLDGDLDPLTGEWWVGPACAWGISGSMCFGVSSWDTLVRELLWIRYDLATI